MPRRIPDADGRAAVDAVLSHIGDDASPADRTTTATAARWLLQRLGERAPGRSVEVRVPPFGAVQVIEGSTHRRGTPPAVVEMNGPTWIAVATGRIAWDEARAAGHITASGERADLAAWLPLEG